MPIERVVVFGDLSGYVDPLEASLRRLGVDVWNRTIPSDLKIVQLGDLVHKGPDSDAAVRLADEMMQNNPEQWVQLMGNHEAQHAGGPAMADVCNCSHTTIRTIESWVSQRKIGVAAAYEGEEGSTLITHSGLVKGLWEKIGRPETASAAANSLNTMLYSRRDKATVLRPGMMLGASTTPGVVWAHGPLELYKSWQTTNPPFHQVHGHTAAFWFGGNQWKDNMEPSLVQNSQVEPSMRLTMTRLGDKDFLCCDPDFNANARSLTPEMGYIEQEGDLAVTHLDLPRPGRFLGI